MHMQRILWSFSHQKKNKNILRWGYCSSNCHGEFVICKRNEGTAFPIVIENYDLQTKYLSLSL